MYSEQYEDRKRYIDEVKNSFSTSQQTGRSTDQEQFAHTGSEKGHRSFLGIRFIFALSLFLAFFALKQTDFSWKGWDTDKITQQIQNTVNLPGFLEQLPLLLR